MKKEKVKLQYPLKATSKAILWNTLSTTYGLEAWFSDKVEVEGKEVIFHWGKTEQRKAEIIASRAFSYIRFRWLDEKNEGTFFELRMTYTELTNDYLLEITDFALPDEKDDLCELWDSQVDTLCRTCGF